MHRNINEITVCIFLGKKGTLNTVLLTDFCLNMGESENGKPF